MSRIFAAASGIVFQPFLPKLKVTIDWATTPSLDGMGPTTSRHDAVDGRAAGRPGSGSPRGRPRSARRAGRRPRPWGCRSGPGTARACSSARVDSALAGSHDDASLFWTSVRLLANPEETPSTTTQKASTIHLVTGPVSLPATWRCMEDSNAYRGKRDVRGLPRSHSQEAAGVNAIPGHHGWPVLPIPAAPGTADRVRRCRRCASRTRRPGPRAGSSPRSRPPPPARTAR